MRTINFKKKIHGPVFSIVTPFKKNGNIDFISLFKVLKFYYLNNVRIFYLMTYNSRLGLLSDEKFLNLILEFLIFSKIIKTPYLLVLQNLRVRLMRL